MKTELEIIYTLHDIVRGAQINADDPINERLMRQFLRIHRGNILNKYYNKAQLIPDECFQNLGAITFLPNGTLYESPVVPKTIRFKNNTGLMLFKDNYPIAILGNEEFNLSSKNKFNKFVPKAKYIHNKLFLDLGQNITCNQINNNPNSELNITVTKLKYEASINEITINLFAALVNPDDEPSYNWTSDNYPMPNELIDDLLQSIKSKDFQIFLQMQGDTTANIKYDDKEQNPNR